MNKELVLPQETVEAITRCAIDKYKKAHENTVKGRRNKRRSGTKRLLRSYRALAAHCTGAVFDSAEVADRNGYSLAELLEVMTGNASENLKIESIQRSAVRTRIIMEHVDTMLDYYRARCAKSGRPEDMRRYRAIHWFYLDDEPKTAETLAKEENTDKRTVYRDINAAVEELSALFFGIDGMAREV